MNPVPRGASDAVAPPFSADPRWLALRFNLAPGAYADPFWWPPLLQQVAAPDTLQPRACIGLSRWLLREHRLASHIDLDFAPTIKRLWLLPASAIRQLAFDLGVLAWRDTIRNCIDGTQRSALRTELGDEALALASNAPAAPPALRRGGSLPQRGPCSDCGALLLLASADPVWHALLRRARLMFGALPGPAWLDLSERDRAWIGERLLGRIDDRYPEWRWLFS